jgi:formylglycine-generating enzyme required for sulfatase activity
VLGGLLTACGRIGFDVSAAPSCAGLPATCGSAGTADCCASPIIPGGTFYRFNDVSGDGMYTDTTHPATVGDFRLDTYIVTVGRFRQFVAAGQGTQQAPPPDGAGARALNGQLGVAGWDPAWNASLPADSATLLAGIKCTERHTWSDAPGANESLGMNCIDWFLAFAFCAWDGGFLPTQTQWTYAAAGGDEQRAFPWSSPPGSLANDCSNANYTPSGTNYCAGPTAVVNRVGSESPTGDGKWGQADLGGELWEWTLDWYGTATTPCVDCAELTPDAAMTRVIHGGAFLNDSSRMRVGFREHAVPPSAGEINGVRCARPR